MPKKIVRIRAPKGFYFNIRETEYNVYVELRLLSNKRKVGRVNLVKDNGKSYETHSSLDARYHGLGYGAKLYARAIQWCHTNGYTVKSSGCSSEMAQRVWRGKTLRKHFRIRTERDEVNRDYDKWYARPKYVK
jgi:GNAT superfamily N-acetyltransferase